MWSCLAGSFCTETENRTKKYLDGADYNYTCAEYENEDNEDRRLLSAEETDWLGDYLEEGDNMDEEDEDQDEKED